MPANLADPAPGARAVAPRAGLSGTGFAGAIFRRVWLRAKIARDFSQMVVSLLARSCDHYMRTYWRLIFLVPSKTAMNTFEAQIS